MTKLRKTNSLHINNARIAGLYDLEHTIGKGHFAVVKLARHVFTGEKVAAKVIDKTRLDPISTSHMMQEVRCMKLVQHPNVVRLYEVIDTQTKLFLILELGDYDMYEWVMRRGYDKGGCKESDAQLYFSQIIQAINYCHKLHVVHRDLKPENVVFFERLGMVKLTDFGFSNLFTPGQQLQTSCGSLAYSAPEILLGDFYDAPAVDVWSLGVILYMLVCGRLPFQESNDSETLTRILDCKFSFPEHVSVECRNLVSSMLVRDPSKRATLSEICQNKWVRAGDRGHAEALPLIVKDNLPLCAHTTIIEQMVAGQIGTEEDIISAIERNDYNHLTATYYLLAERVLFCYRQAEANRLMAAAEREFSSVDENSPDEFTQNSTVPGTSTASSTRSRSRSNSWRGPAPRRAYSILKEESEEELSSYLRSSSIQSSRFFNVPPAGAKSSRENASSRASYIAMSRANSNDSFAPVGSSAILEDEIESEEMDEGMSKTIIASEEENNVKERKESGRMATFTIEQLQQNQPGTSGGSSAVSTSAFEPSITSTPILFQRLLAPIHENNRDQSPDIVIQRLRHKNSTNQSIFDGQSDEEMAGPGGSGEGGNEGRGASFYLPRQTRQRTTSSHSVGGRIMSGGSSQQQLPPLPSSPEHQNIGGSKFRIGSVGSRNSSTSSFAGGNSRINNNNISSSTSNRPLRNATSLELFPTQNSLSTQQNGDANFLSKTNTSFSRRCLPATSPPTPNPSNNNNTNYNYYSTLWGAPATLERHANFPNLNTLPSSSNLLKQQRKSSSTTGSSLLRRNSSPSVALIRANSLNSSRDRISPHAIQELLELSRLSGRMRRTASPDGASSSHISSRSASPSCMSSGRVSPLYSSSPGGGLVMRMLKSGTPSGSLLSSGGGMRKLSSSPHLLGICEEIEECDFSLESTQNPCDGVDGPDPDCLTSGRRSVTSIDQPFWKNPPLISRSARSASMGLTSMGRLSLGGNVTNKKIVSNLTTATNQTS
ncbi:hypothetical protein ACQ4LE_008778 [Meloidogyne hapla]|uniref:SNF-related serine/threonine-protein kinase n=1 Tax=Meloidogyne hapla TaxID=6305 RepID=A0A1I8BV19_MELHA